MAHDVNISYAQELRPIRIGTIAEQPQADTSTLLFIGLAALLPAQLRSLCSCAGLFYARVLWTDGGQYHLEIAALAHYFTADQRTRDRHVRRIVLAAADFTQLLEWDRSLAGKATCDVRELVEEHMAMIEQSQRVQVSVATDTSLADKREHQHIEENALPHGDASKENSEDTEVDLQIIARVSVPHRIVQEVFKRLNITANRERRVHTALLVAALDTIQMQLDSSLAVKTRQRLEREHDEIRRVQRWRRQRRNEGYGWQRVVTLMPIVSGTGWDLVIGRPAA